MGIIETVKKGLTLSVKQVNLIVLFFIVNAVMGLISMPFANPENAGQAPVIAASLGISLVFFLIFIFLQGGALGILKDVYKQGSGVFSNFVSYGKKFYLRILGLFLLYIAIALIIVLLLALAGSGLLAIADNAFMRGLVAAIAIVIMFATIVELIFPIYIIICEDTSVIKAFVKGLKISWDNFWKVLGLFLVLAIIAVIIGLVVGLVTGLVTFPLPFVLGQVILTIVNSLVQSFIAILMWTAFMGYYLNLKGSEASQA